jgi:DNA polymerase III delta prime subunit
MNTMYKHAPRNLSGFVFATEQLKKQVMRYANGSNMAPLVLYGKNGTGKSTLAKLIPEAIDGISVKVNRVMASTLNSEVEVMNKFTRHVMFDRLFTYESQSRNYTIIEEVNIEAKASSALRVAMDQMIGRDLFIFTTNDIGKIDYGLASRATLIEVPPIPPDIFIEKAMEILSLEGLEVERTDVFNILDSVFELHQDNRKYFEALDDLIFQTRIGCSDMKKLNE